MSTANLILQLGNLKRELNAILARGIVEECAQFFIKLSNEQPLLSPIITGLITKTAKDAADTITLYTQIQFDAAGIEFIRRVQTRLKEMKVQR